MFARIGWYLLFLVSVAIYILLLIYLQKKQHGATKSVASRFLVSQLQIAVGLVPIVLMPWTLTGFFSRNFLLLLLTAFEISSLFSYISSRLTSQQTALTMKLWWFELLGLPSMPDEEERRHSPHLAFKKSMPVLLFLLVLVVIILLAVVYFIVVSYFYFANPVHSATAARKILTLNMGLYILGALFAVLLNVRHISSKRINDGLRKALFLSQAVYALQIGIILTVYLGLIGVSVEAIVPASLTLPSRFRYYIPIIALTALYLLILVIPYFIGLAGRRREQIALYQIIGKWLTRVIETVGIPSHKDAEQLGKLREEFSAETDQWVESELMLKDFALKIERGQALKKPVEDLAEAYNAFKDHDTRFIRFNWTERMRAKLDEMKEEYDLYAGQWNMMPMYTQLGGAYTSFFRDEERQNQEKLKLTEQRRILAPVVARAVGVLGSIPVVLQYGQKLMGLLPFTH